MSSSAPGRSTAWLALSGGQRVEVRVEGNSEKVAVVCHWAGGHQTGATLIRPVARFEQLSTYPHLMDRAAALHGEGKDPSAIASVLNREGWRPPRRRETFNAAMVRSLLYRQGHRAGRRNQPIPANPPCKPNEWTLGELARKLEMPAQTLYAWRRNGRLKARSQQVNGRLIWLIHADQAEIARLTDLRQIPRAAAMARLQT